MSTKICPSKCGGAAGMNYMRGEVVQEFNMETKAPQITDWTCPYCGFKETLTVEFAQSGGTYNSGVGYKMDPVPNAPLV